MNLGQRLLAAKKQANRKPILIPIKAKGRHPGHRRHCMNRLEQAYARELDRLASLGVVRWYVFERITLVLARPDRTRMVTWCADFVVMVEDGTLEFVDVKGRDAEAQRAKVKIAAEQFPIFRFIVVRSKQSTWVREEI